VILLPLNDDNPNQRFPAINWLLIALNIAVFIYEIRLAQQGQLEASMQDWALIPRQITTSLNPEHGLDLIRSMFLHGGWLHLLGNMLFLFIFGDDVEDAFGSFRYLVFYLSCGLIASLAQVVLTPYTTAPVIGASGAIAGVLGAFLLLFPGARIRTLFWFIIVLKVIRIPAALLLGGWFLFQFAQIYFAPAIGIIDQGVAYAAHVGGFIGGLLITLALRTRNRVTA
jgi:membrane associated rhomboid family serine protease